MTSPLRRSNRPLRGIVMFMTDQMRADHVGFGGNKDIKTPHLDALAARSTVFDNAHVANPTCMPNRATIATGRWPSTHGTRTNGITLDWRANTFMRSLRRDGWATGAAGKLHFQNMGWPWEDYELDDIRRVNPLQFAPGALDAAPSGLPDGWDRYEDFGRHREAKVELPPDYYGFDRVDLVVGHADAPSGHYRDWALARGVDPIIAGGYDNATEKFDGWDEVYRSEVPAALHPTSYVKEKAIEQIERFSREDRPFFVCCSFPDPHHPFSPPAPYFSMYDPDSLTLPATFLDPHTKSPLHLRRMIEQKGQPRVRTALWAPTERQLRASLAAEYGLISFVDDAIGEVIAALGSLGLLDDTALLFTSDHGDMLGDHGLMLKHAAHYRALTRVPLVVHVPGEEAKTISALTSSADIAPTVMDLAGVPHYRGIQGTSLVNELPTNRALLVEEEHLFGIEALPAPICIRTLITSTARLTMYDRPDAVGAQPADACGLTGELYDHTNDPDELNNMWADSDGQQLRAQMTERMAVELMRLTDRGVAPWASA